MKNFKQAGAAAGALLVLLICIAGVVYWFAAEHEIRIFCELIGDMEEPAEVQRLLGTAEHVLLPEAVSAEFSLWSKQNLYSSECMVQPESGGFSINYSRYFSLEKAAAWLIVLLFSGLAVFQVALAAGRPYGEWAWGGAHKVLPLSQKIGSGMAAVIFLLGSFVILIRAGILPWQAFEKIAETGTYILFLIFVLSMFGNCFSKSKKEKQLMLPLSFLLALLCSVIVLSA